MAFIREESFVGKTIKSMEVNAVNVTKFHFTDGTSATLEVAALIPNLNLYGIVEPIREKKPE